MHDTVTPTGSKAKARVLITGADGLIGRAAVAHLQQSGFAVTALSRGWVVPSLADRVVTGDASDEDVVRSALEEVTAVVHLAAIPHPSLGTPRAVFVGNTAATFTVLSAAGEAGIRRAVIASSINAFGIPMNRHAVAPAYFPLDEESPVAHDDAYSLSKWVDEQTARWAHSRWGMDVVSLRLPLVRTLESLRERALALKENPIELARLSREGWAYLEMSDALDAVQRAITVPLVGAHTLMVAAADTLAYEPTDVLLDRYMPGSERRQNFAGLSAPIDTSAAYRLLGWKPKQSLHSPDELLNQEVFG